MFVHFCFEFCVVIDHSTEMQHSCKNSWHFFISFHIVLCILRQFFGITELKADKTSNELITVIFQQRKSSGDCRLSPQLLVNNHFSSLLATTWCHTRIHIIIPLTNKQVELIQRWLRFSQMTLPHPHSLAHRICQTVNNDKNSKLQFALDVISKQKHTKV